MSYSDKYTEKKLSELEKRLQKIYQQVYSELKAQATEYFESFSARYLKEHNAYMEGKYTYDEFLQWVNNQVARGARWEALRNQMAQRLTDANKLAADYINDTTPKVYAENYNYSAYEIEKGSGISFTLLDEDTVRRLSEREIELLPQASVDIPKDKQWNRQKVQNAVLQGILQGDSVGKLATRLENVASMNRNAAVRNARTMITGAQNGGRQESYSRASAMGIAIEKEWMSANDGRVRDSHMHLNGVRVKYNETFPNGCMYPGDSRGAPCEVYNCRCTMVAITPHADQTRRTSNTAESYKAWKEEKHENGFIEKVAGKLSSTKKNIQNALSGKSETVKLTNGTKVEILKTTPKQQAVIDDALSEFSEGERQLLQSYGVKTKVADISRSFYRPSDRTVYLARDFEEKKAGSTVVHEHAHALYQAMDLIHNKLYNEVVEDGLPDAEDIIKEWDMQHSEGIKEPKLSSDKFITVYQGRIYGNANQPNATVAQLLKEYISVGYETYVYDPYRLKRKDPRLYNFIKCEMRGET